MTEIPVSNAEPVRDKRARFLGMSPKRVLEVARAYVNGPDFEIFLEPLLVGNASISDIAARLGQPEEYVEEIIDAFEVAIIEKHLETLPDGYGHAGKILATTSLRQTVKAIV